MVILPLYDPGLVRAQEMQCSVHAGWQDSDGDRIPDIVETAQDTDTDGIPNYLDEGSDNDGIPDSSEAFNIESLSGVDSNNDGIDDTYDIDPALLQFAWHDPDADGVANDQLPIDSDNDGTADYLDTDSDNDGLTDATEINSNSDYREADTDNDGLTDSEELALGSLPNKWDSDDGGVSDGMEVLFGSDPLLQSDDHVHPNNLDVDNDGISNDIEGYADTDLDRIPDYLDTDSDNDSWLDIREAGLPDANNDGMVDDATDLNADGMADSVAGLIVTLRDTDSDNIPDTRDLDADNDGVPDEAELPLWTFAPSANINRFDIDADGQDNNVDTDADGDSLFDLLEVGYYEIDSNGIVDLMTDVDLDGIVDSVDVDFTNDNSDSDNDGVADHFDTQHSFETTTVIDWTTLEEEVVTLPNLDLDQDSIVDRHDPDHDGNGLADDFAYLVPNPADADGDGLTALFDADESDALDASLLLPVAASSAMESQPVTLRPIATYIPCAGTDANGESEVADPETTDTESPELGQAIPTAQTPGITGGDGPSPETTVLPDIEAGSTTDATGSSGGGGAPGTILLALFLLYGRYRRKPA